MLLALTKLAIQLDLFAIAGGGGSSGGGGGGGGSSGGGSSFSGGASSGSSGDVVSGLIFFVIFMIIFAAIAVFAIKKEVNRRQKVKAEITEYAENDPAWSDILEKSKQIFIKHQDDWTNFHIDSMGQYMSPSYFEHTKLMMASLKLMNRQNRVEEINITNAFIDKAEDDVSNTKDKFTLNITASVKDVIFNTASSKEVYSENLISSQKYNFIRNDDGRWLIDSIDQATAVLNMAVSPIREFAQKNNYYYSLDWGYLLLPERGQLFKGGTFGVSDINNHVVGVYEDIIFQIYTYTAKPSKDKTVYLIAQVPVPKEYGNIVVRRKSGWPNFGIKGLNKLSTEWGDFNKKYEVFASNSEQATSFELLHPVYMEKLEALPFEVNIEVVDNVVYLYNEIKALSLVTNPKAYAEARYVALLELLKDAYKEMRK